MAETVLIGVAKSVLPKLGDLALREAIVCWNARGDLEDLEDTMDMIQDVLLDAEEKQKKNRAVKRWLKRLKRVLYDADDTFDEVLARDQSKELGSNLLQKVCALFSVSNPVWLSWTVSKKVSSIRKKLDRITTDMERFNFRKHQPEDDLFGVPMSSVREGHRDETSSHALKDGMVGRVADKEKIVKLLDDEGSRIVPSVIAIVGIGGTGKTTLAQVVYNDSKQFELKAWVCVYSKSNHREVIEGKILRSLLQSSDLKTDGKTQTEARLIKKVIEEKYHDVSLNEIQSMIEKELKNKKYLLILDDVWDDRQNKWNIFIEFLRKGKIGSKIVATMRYPSVAMAMGAYNSHIHNIGELEEMEALELFESRAMKPEWEGKENIKKLIKEICYKCPRYPLVLQSVASMLYSKANVEGLKHVNRILPSLSMLEERESMGILRVIKVSYDHLPPHLKSCFAYCALFPKDHEFDKEVLTRLWIAQGLVQPPIADESLEDVANNHFMELLDRSFFLTEKKEDMHGDVIMCHKMHDIMHDLAQYVSSEEMCVISRNMRKQYFSKDLRHVVLDNCLQYPLPLQYARQVRSILLWRTTDIPPTCAELISSAFTSLRVLDLHNMELERVSSCIGELIHLRYLDLSENREISYLPNSITNLINLQTMNLNYCDELKRLPNDFSRLINIRHLKLKNCHNLSCLPHGFGQLTSLQTFEGELVMSKAQSNSVLDVLLGLQNLRYSEELGIKYIGLDKTDIGKFINSPDISAGTQWKLNKLSLAFECWDPEEAKSVLGSIFYRLRLGNLQILEIYNCRAPGFPRWGRATIPSLYNTLVKIHFKHLDYCVILPPLSRLDHLKSLTVTWCEKLKYMEERGNGDGHAGGRDQESSSSSSSLFFPSLVELHMGHLNSLEGWFANSTSSTSSPLVSITTATECPSLDCSFTSLKKLRLYGCSKLRSLFGGMVHADALEELVIDDCRYLFDINETFNCNNLQKLQLGGLGNMESLSLWMPAHLTQQLRLLPISHFPKLTSLGDAIHNLASLQKLRIYKCENLDLWEDQDEEGNSPSTWQLLSDTAKSLHSLEIKGLFELESLPRGIRHLTTLQTLNISQIRNLKAVPAWIDSLTNLQTLEIEYCRGLTTLPETMSNLCSLQRLEIRCGKQIVEKCKETTGEYWPLIQHIPDRDIWP